MNLNPFMVSLARQFTDIPYAKELTQLPEAQGLVELSETQKQDKSASLTVRVEARCDILPHQPQAVWCGLPKFTLWISWLLCCEISPLA
ncbi:hypothetical protein [Brasilonema sp. UFV-L1]|uniref:hypothetical protein n=1 Tax=Brasilonema sp. UFV-L1 TaxID=2234130 RepID=UPI00145F1229|nr:hypothetical protein [Brasilonema sp. UFV-L1]